MHLLRLSLRTTLYDRKRHGISTSSYQKNSNIHMRRPFTIYFAVDWGMVGFTLCGLDLGIRPRQIEAQCQWGTCACNQSPPQVSKMSLPPMGY